MARVNAALLWNQLRGSCQLRLARLAHPQVAHVSHQPAKASLTSGNPQHLSAKKQICSVKAVKVCMDCHLEIHGKKLCFSRHLFLQVAFFLLEWELCVYVHIKTYINTHTHIYIYKYNYTHIISISKHRRRNLLNTSQSIWLQQVPEAGSSSAHGAFLKCSGSLCLKPSIKEQTKQV